MNQPFTKHEEKALIIVIPCNAPALLQENLLRGLAAVMKQQFITPIDNKQDAFYASTLAELQQALIPNSVQLEKAHLE